MKSFKVIDGKVKVDGILYGQSPLSDVNVMGKMGKIHSIMIEGRGQFFPISGEFNDGTIPVVDSTNEVLDAPTAKGKKGKLAKTELKESSSAAVDVNGKLIVKKGKKASK
jgi:hypothetical protein